MNFKMDKESEEFERSPSKFLMGLNRCAILVGKRIPELKNFYASKGLSMNDLPAYDKPKDLKKSADDVKGRWVLEKILSAAKSLNIAEFLEGKCQVPRLAECEEYELAHADEKMSGLAQMKKSVNIREQELNDIEVEMDSYEAKVRQLNAEPAARVFHREEVFTEGGSARSTKQKVAAESAVKEREQAELKEDEDAKEAEVSRLKECHRIARRKWLECDDSLQQNRNKISQEERSSKMRAQEQCEADGDAIARVSANFNLLKTYVTKLLDDMPSIEKVCKNMGDGRIDPLEAGDMITVYANLKAKFRKSDKIGVIAAVVTHLMKTFGEGSLMDFIRVQEEFIQYLEKLHIQSFSVADIAAMCVMKEMPSEMRKEFLEELQRSSRALNFHADQFDDDSGSTVDEKESLFEKIKVQGIMAQNVKEINEVFGNKKIVSQPAPPKSSVLAKTDEENRNVFAMEAESRGVCRTWSANGTCRYAERCKFAHDNNESKPTPQKLCYEYLELGKCSKGVKCRYIHPDDHDLQKCKQLLSPKSETNGAGPPRQTGVEVPGDKKSNKVGGLLQSMQDKKAAAANMCCVTLENAQVMAVSHSASAVDMRIGWDTYCSANATSDRRVIDSNIKDNLTGLMAKGLNGTCKVDLVGDSSILGERNIMLMEKSSIPHLLSVGSACLEDSIDNLPTVFIFGATGATRLRMNETELMLLSEIVESASSEGRVTGEAELSNGVFIQHKGGVPLQASVEETEQTFAVTQLYGGRVQMDSVDTLIGLMFQSGFDEGALRNGVEYGTLQGLPLTLTEEAITLYMRKHGRDESQLLANIKNSVLTTPIDYKKEVTEISGETVLIDNVDVSMSRMKVETVDKNGATVERKTVIPAIGQYKDVVLVLDQASLFALPIPRVSKKNPHLIVTHAAKKWITRWRNLKSIFCDDEFVTIESQKAIDELSYEHKLQIQPRQAVPGDHRFATGLVEGCNGVIQKVAQGNLNRGDEHVQSGLITERQKRMCWYQAYRLAVFAWNGGPCKNNKYRSRLLEGTGLEFNLSMFPMLPFFMRLIAKKLQYDEDGRGEVCLYMGPSMLVRGGIIVLSISTMSLSVKYAFIPRPYMPDIDKADLTRGAAFLYGDLLRVIEDVPNLLGVPDDIDDDDIQMTAEVEQIVDHADDNAGDLVLDSDATAEVMLDGDKEDKIFPLRGDIDVIINDKLIANKPMAEFRAKVPSNPYEKVYKARQRKQTVLAVVQDRQSDRPSKPTLPTKSQAKRSDRWRDAMKREYVKHKDEDSFVPLPKDENGKHIFPADAIVMRMIDVLEFKWKQDPQTNDFLWLECVRAVIDGSMDKRQNENVYAETPSRTVFLMLMSCGISSGDFILKSDATRAYLNAISIDRNLVVMFAEEVLQLGLGFEKYMLINKGVYGTKKGALSWEYFFEDKAVDKMNFKKLLVAKSIYIKEVADKVVRLFRHSDDCMMSGSNKESVVAECEKLSLEIRMSPWGEVDLFLGAEFEYFENVVLIRQTGKINEAKVKYETLFLEFNPKRRTRNCPLPSNALEEEELLFEEDRAFLNEESTTAYRGIVGITGWIVTTRFDGKFAHHVAASRMNKPRRWDLRCAVWFVEFLVNTVDWPLVLGGPIIDIEVMSDGSHAIMPERRSIIAHFMRTGPLSGAVYAEVETVKIAVTNIFEVEVKAASNAVDTLQYGITILNELRFRNENSRRVRVDNEGSIEWFSSNRVTERSRHFQIRYFHVRHSAQEGLCNMEWVMVMIMNLT